MAGFMYGGRRRGLLFFLLEPFDFISNFAEPLLLALNFPRDRVLVSGVQARDQIRDNRGMRYSINKAFWSRARDLAFLGVGSDRTLSSAITFGSICVQAIAHQLRVELLQSLRAKPVGVEGDILTDEGVVAECIGDGNKAGRTRIEGSEGLEKEEGLKGSVGGRWRHPPLPVENGSRGDGGHGGRRLGQTRRGSRRCTRGSLDHQRRKGKIERKETEGDAAEEHGMKGKERESDDGGQREEGIDGRREVVMGEDGIDSRISPEVTPFLPNSIWHHGQVTAKDTDNNTA